MSTELKLQCGPAARPSHIYDEGGFDYAAIVAEPGAPPSCFEAPLHASGEGPPRETIVFGLETDRFGMRARFVEGLRAAAGEGGEGGERFGDLLEACFRDLFGGRGATQNTPGFYGWLLGVLRDEASPEVRRELARGLRRCPLPEARALLSAEGVAPDERPQEDGEGPVAEIGALLRAPETTYNQLNRLAHSAHEIAARGGEGRQNAEGALAEFLTGLLDGGGLERALRAGELWRARYALQALAAVGRPSAVAFARDAAGLLDCHEFEEDGGWEGREFVWLVRLLGAFPEPGDVEAELDRQGVFAPAGLPPGPPALTLEEALRRRGRLLGFDAETGHVPASNPDVLYWLSELVGVEGAYFDQEVSREGGAGVDGAGADVGEGEGAADGEGAWGGGEEEADVGYGEPGEGLRYTLRAYYRGEAVSCAAQNNGDYYDVETCVGLLNALSRRSGGGFRAAMLGPPDQAVLVVAAPEPSLRAWREAGFLTFSRDVE